jgi:spore coat polysaccharide biosynthesis protein SpsF
MSSTQPRIVAIIQARMGSTRLPGKVLEKVLGQPMLEHILRRISTAHLVAQLVVATTQRPEDDAVCSLLQHLGIPQYRGSTENVLERYYQAAKQFEADIIVRLTADNPFIDGQFVDWVIKQYLQADPPVEYIETAFSKTFPVGLSVELFSFRALEVARNESKTPAEREHVTPFFRNNPQRFPSQSLSNRNNLAELRWTVDTPEDLALVRRVYEHFGHANFSWQEVWQVMKQHPEWADLNRHVSQQVV